MCAGPARNTGHMLEREGGAGDKRLANVHRKIVYLEEKVETQTQQLTNTLGRASQVRSQSRGRGTRGEGVVGEQARSALRGSREGTGQGEVVNGTNDAAERKDGDRKQDFPLGAERTVVIPLFPEADLQGFILFLRNKTICYSDA